MYRIPNAPRPLAQPTRPCMAFFSALGMTLLGGCAAHHTTTTTSSTTFNTNYSRSYMASNLSLGSGQTGALVVSLSNYSTAIAGTLSVGTTSAESRARTRQTTAVSSASIPLTGTYNSQTGAFSLSGSVTRGASTVYTVTATGTLNTTADGGTATVTLNGASAAVTFASSTYSSDALTSDYFPVNSSQKFVYQDTSQGMDSSDTTANTPSVSTDDGYSFLGGAGYDPGGSSDTGVQAGNPSGNQTPSGAGISGVGATLGQITQQQLKNGTTVQKAAFLDTTNGKVSYYVFYTADDTALTQYGYQSLNELTGGVEDSETINPGSALPFTLYAGQTVTQSVTESFTDNYSYSTVYANGVATTTYDDGGMNTSPSTYVPTPPDAGTSSSTDGTSTTTTTVSGSTTTTVVTTNTAYGSFTDTTTYNGSTVTQSSSSSNVASHTITSTFNGFESITVPAGTFTAAKYTVVDTQFTPAYSSDDFPNGAETIVDTTTYYLVTGMGVVQEDDVYTDTTAATTDSDGNTNIGNTYISYDDLVLTSTTAAASRS